MLSDLESLKFSSVQGRPKGMRLISVKLIISWLIKKGAHILIVIQTIKHIHFVGSLEDDNLLTLAKETFNIANIRNEIDKTLMRVP